MNFFKNIFSGKKDDESKSSSPKEGVFTCDNCGEERPLAQKKAHMASEGDKSKNVCEFC